MKKIWVIITLIFISIEVNSKGLKSEHEALDAIGITMACAEHFKRTQEPMKENSCDYLTEARMKLYNITTKKLIARDSQSVKAFSDILSLSVSERNKVCNLILKLSFNY